VWSLPVLFFFPSLHYGLGSPQHLKQQRMPLPLRRSVPLSCTILLDAEEPSRTALYRAFLFSVVWVCILARDIAFFEERYE